MKNAAATFLIHFFIANFWHSTVAYANLELNQEINVFAAHREINQENLSQVKGNIFDQAFWAASNIHYWTENQFHFEFRPEFRFLKDAGTSVSKIDPAFTTLAPSARYFPLEWRLEKGSKTESFLSFEKAKISYQSEKLEAYLGRKPIGLGILRIFPVWNKFSKISPTSFAAPQIITTQDGAGLRYQLEDKMVQLISIIDKQTQRNAYLGELVFFADTLEVHFLAGKWWDANSLGLAFSKDLGGINLKSETLLIADGENINGSILQAGAGGEYAFSETLSGILEVFYESNGHADKKDYQPVLKDRFAFLQSKAYGFLQAFWKTTATLNLSQGFLINVYDQSTLILSKAEYSYSESTDFTLALSKPVGSSRSEFSTDTFRFPVNRSFGTPTIISLAIKSYF